METYHSRCPKCGIVSRTDYKTGIGKTKEQLEAWAKRRETCPRCGGPAKELTIAEERAEGIEPDPVYKAAAGLIADALAGERHKP